MGWKYVKIDFELNGTEHTFLTCKLLGEALRAIDSNIMIEGHQGYAASVFDALRSYDLSNTHGDQICKWMALSRYKTYMCHAPGKVLDVCSAGTTVPSTSITSEFALDLLSMQAGYGKPDWYFTQFTLNNCSNYNSSYVFVSKVFGTAIANIFQDFESDIFAVFGSLAQLPAEIPQREIVGDWETSYNTLLAYSGGASVSYDTTNGLTIVPPNITIDALAPNATTLTGTMQEGLEVEGVSGATFGTVSYPTGTTWSLPISGLPPGISTIVVRAMDGATEVGMVSTEVEVVAAALEPDALQSQSILSPVQLTGILQPTPLQSQSALSTIQLTGVLQPSSLQSSSALAQIILSGPTPVMTVEPVGVAQSPSILLTGTRQVGVLVQVMSAPPSVTWGAGSYPTSTTWSVQINNLVPGDNPISLVAIQGGYEVFTTTVTATLPGLQGLLVLDNLASTSTLEQVQLIGVISPANLASTSTMSPAQLVGVVRPDGLLSQSVLSEPTLLQVLTGSGSIRSPNGEPIQLMDIYGAPLNLKRFADGLWQ
jgi:hypothetical protein